MKALSLWQPWASLLVMGLKKIETRSWPTTYRGPLAIHAAKTTYTGLDADLTKKIEDALGLRIEDLPRGGIIGTVDIKECFRITVPPEHWTERLKVHAQDSTGQGLRYRIEESEFHFGDYRAGRYIWITENPKAFKKIIPFTGRQGFFNVPDEALRVCRACGCSEHNACEGGCAWIEQDLCSACAEPEDLISEIEQAQVIRGEQAVMENLKRMGF